jgi:hypothetical protein
VPAMTGAVGSCNPLDGSYVDEEPERHGAQRHPHPPY